MRTHRGFTLVEMLIAMLIAVVVIAGVVVAANAQTQAYASGTRQRLAQASARNALLYIEQRLSRAGFGTDPALALDLQWYAPGGTLCPAELAPCLRDSRTNSDELVFYARNSSYWLPGDNNPAQPGGNAWVLQSASSTSFTIAAHGGEKFYKGQVLLAVCRGGQYYAFATFAGPNTTVAAAANVDLPLVTVDPNDPFKRQDLADVSTIPRPAGADCFGSGSARLFLVDRFRFHVRPVTLGTMVVPYLVLDQGIDRDDSGVVDANDELVIAEGVENLQVAYVLANPALPTPVAADAGTGALALVAGNPGSITTANELTTTAFPGAPQPGQSVYSASSFYPYAWGPPLSAQRQTDHQANVRAVKLAIVARSAGSDGESAGDTFLPFNMTAQPAWVTSRQVSGRDGYQRAMFETTVQLPNMTSGGMTYF